MTADFSRVQQLFDAQLHEQKLHTAAQLVVMQDGGVVVDCAGGTGRDSNVTEETPLLLFSISKVLTGLCVHRLVETGQVEMDAPVSRYWQEFGRKGKETATIRHVFLHQAGIPAPHLRQQVFLWPFWSLVTRQLAGEQALFAPGTQTGYHLVNYGFIFGEVVRRVTGMPLNRYFQREFVEPLGLQRTWMRIPAAELAHSPRLVSNAREMDETATLFNLSIIRRALIPAATVHSTARDLAAIFQMLLDGGVYRGKNLLLPETVARAVQSGYNGWDSYLKENIHWGHGFILGGGIRPPGSDPRKDSLGWGSSAKTFSGMGMGTSMVWADPQARLVVAFTCNGMLGGEACPARWAAISNAVWDAVA